MVRVAFVAESPAELSALVAEFVNGSQMPPAQGIAAPATAADPEAWDSPEFRAALGRIGSDNAKKLLVMLARKAMTGQADINIENTAELQHEFGLASGIAFAGIVGGINRIMKADIGRRLVESEWRADHSSWCVPRAAAPIILERPLE